MGWLLGASGTKGGAAGLVWVTLVSPDRKDFTIVAVNSGGGSASLSVALTDSSQPADGPLQLPSSLQVWRTEASRAFFHDGTIAVTSGSFTATIPGASAASFTTVSDAVHAEPPVPPRTSFPLPYHSDYASQKSGEEGQYLSSAFGGFNIYTLPSGKNVLRQGSVGCPVGWDTSPGETPECLDLPPFATLPSGTNWRNYNVSVRASVAPAAGESDAYASLCGRIAVWPLRLETLKMSPMVGTCLIINSTSWRLEQRDNVKAVVHADGPLAASAGGWHSLSLAFDEDAVFAQVDGAAVGSSSDGVPITSAWSGVAGVGSGRHHAYFDALSLEQVAGKKGITPGSFVLDVAPMGCLCAGCHHPIPYNKPVSHSRKLCACVRADPRRCYAGGVGSLRADSAHRRGLGRLHPRQHPGQRFHLHHRSRAVQSAREFPARPI